MDRLLTCNKIINSKNRKRKIKLNKLMKVKVKNSKPPQYHNKPNNKNNNQATTTIFPIIKANKSQFYKLFTCRTKTNNKYQNKFQSNLNKSTSLILTIKPFHRPFFKRKNLNPKSKPTKKSKSQKSNSNSI